MEAEGARSVGQGAPRKVYRITSEGRDAQFNAVLDALSTPGQPNSSFLLGLSNLPVVPKDQALQAMGQYASALETRLTQLLTREDEQQPLPDFVQAMFDYSTAMIATELAWLNEYMQRVETQNG